MPSTIPSAPPLNPLALKEIPLYYYHSRTDYYNMFFFEYWKNISSKLSD